MPDKKLLTAAALTATLAVGGGVGALLGTPFVSGAQESDDPTTTTEAPDEHRGRFRFGLEAAAEALGVSVEDLRTALEDGRTIADVAEERGVDVQAVIDAMVADATERIDQRVSDGDLDADRAAELKEDLPERITEVVNGEGPAFHFGHHRFGAPFAGVSAAADALGMSASELRAALRDGQTIADVAEERGVDLQTVIDAMVADATERIDERAAEAKEDLPERITDLVNGEVPDRPGGIRAGLDAAAEALGISVEDLRSALRDDRTIADVAGERGVDVQAVIDAMVAEATAHIDEAVAEGDLDADRAAELKEELPERITDLVNEGPRFHRGPFGPGD